MGRYAELQKAWDENREKFRRLKEEMEKNEAAFRKIDQEMEAMEQEPIKDSDVVVMFSSQFETDYVVCKITDQSREWVKEQMETIAGMDEDALGDFDVEEYFRDQGKDVLLMMDSLTRFSMAQREIGLASGEPPVTRGYPPSVYSEMPKLLERAGRAAVGSITGLYTVLVDGDDFNEPITDTARSILDGHIMLDRKLGHKNHYPAIDILQSISRCMSQIATREHKQAANKLKNVLATYNEAEDLINIGAYKKGSNPNIDYAISRIDAVNGFLCQGTDEKFTFEETVQMLEELFADQG